MALREFHERAELRAHRAGIQRLRRSLRAFRKVLRLSRQGERCRGVRQHYITIGASFTVQHPQEQARIGRSVAAVELFN